MDDAADDVFMYSNILRWDMNILLWLNPKLFNVLKIVRWVFFCSRSEKLFGMKQLYLYHVCFPVKILDDIGTE